MSIPFTWDQEQNAVQLVEPSGAPAGWLRWQITDRERTFVVHRSHRFPEHPMYDVYETTDGTPPTPASRLTQLHSLTRARLLIARLARPAFTTNWTAWQTALVIGEGINLATAPVHEHGTWNFTFDFALDTEREGYQYPADGTLLPAAFQAAAAFFDDNEVTNPDANEDGILGVVLAAYARI